MDAMSDAIEGADVMLYGVSLAYKESANVSTIESHRCRQSRLVATSTAVLNLFHPATLVFCMQCRLEANYGVRAVTTCLPWTCVAVLE